MNKYNIAARADGAGFDVHIVTTNGTRQTLLGFATESEAQLWVAQDQRLSRATDQFHMGGERPGKS